MIPRKPQLGKSSIYEDPKTLDKTIKLNKSQPASCQSAVWVSHIYLETGIVMEHMETPTV